jgi:hypothetical protein
VVRIEPERIDEFRTAHVSRGLKPPEPEQVAVFRVQPVRRPSRLPALIGQVEAKQRVADELAARVWLVERLEPARCRV